ncbi:nucleotide sugar dehydrogenase [Aliidiomarina sp. Khilg15.8]
MAQKICVVGLGYVGLPLAMAFDEKFSVVGMDISERRIAELKEGVDSLCEVDDDDVRSSGIQFTSELQDCADAAVYVITVPTPIDKGNRPDLRPLESASRMIGSVLKKGDIVIYESTVYPGVTEEVCVPLLESASGLTFNSDFFCGYSPERINPGDKVNTVKNILKVTAGSTPEIAEVVDNLYKSVITAGTYRASSIKVAEAAKVIENTQRDVNIALINELAMIFHQMGIDTNEVIDAAATKWNFTPYTPGLVGGHCIGVDPYYLTFRAEELGYKPNLILASRQINNGMSKYIAEMTIKTMIDSDLKIKGAKVLVLGATFKENCPDQRNSKVENLITELSGYGLRVSVYEPWVEPDNREAWLVDVAVDSPSGPYDTIVVAVAHNEFKAMQQADYESLSSGKPVIIDIKGIVDSPSWKL